MATSSRPEVPVVIARHYDLVQWLMEQVPKFPRSHKFVLGDRILAQALDLLDALVEAAYTRDKSATLRRANLGAEKLRYLLRLAHDLALLDARRYAHASERLDEVGRMVGGWLRARDGR